MLADADKGFSFNRADAASGSRRGAETSEGANRQFQAKERFQRKQRELKRVRFGLGKDR